MKKIFLSLFALNVLLYVNPMKSSLETDIMEVTQFLTLDGSQTRAKLTNSSEQELKNLSYSMLEVLQKISNKSKSREMLICQSRLNELLNRFNTTQCIIAMNNVKNSWPLKKDNKPDLDIKKRLY